ncbi:hypothetical protein ACFQH6_15895 [Halobacteriaceae archaeon GCM10025711]
MVTLPDLLLGALPTFYGLSTNLPAYVDYYGLVTVAKIYLLYLVVSAVELAAFVLLLLFVVRRVKGAIARRRPT